MTFFSLGVTLLLGYLLGSIPTGYLAGLVKGIDIRKVGSGNIGATNVLRTLGKPAGILVLIIDAVKGFLASSALAGLVWEWMLPIEQRNSDSRQYFAIASGVAAILGHNYTCWLKFKGGKGIATTAGVLLALMPYALLAALALWLAVVGLSRYVSLGSVLAAVILPFATWFFYGNQLLTFVATLMSALAIYKHRSNIRRLIGGTENRLGAKKASRYLSGMKIAILGAGAWGTAISCLLHHGGHSVTLWGPHKDRVDHLRRVRRNELHLPGISIPKELELSSDFEETISGSEMLVAAVPSEAFREICSALRDFSGIIVSLTKGIEYNTSLTMSGVVQENAPRAAVVALSGPSFAIEVARGIPTAIVAASDNPATARAVQEVFHSPRFRVYTSNDLIGVELGGALKNVIAIAAGVCDGLGLGDNSKAALITRAIAEIRRLGVARGAQPETFSGLSGLGDLTLTCFSRLSRNRAFGERLGRGENAKQVIKEVNTVVEGYPTARSAFRLARTCQIVTPIIDEVHAMLYQDKNLAQAVNDLIGRDSKAED